MTHPAHVTAEIAAIGQASQTPVAMPKSTPQTAKTAVITAPSSRPTDSREVMEGNNTAPAPGNAWNPGSTTTHVVKNLHGRAVGTLHRASRCSEGARPSGPAVVTGT